jgi:hypothetical protein
VQVAHMATTGNAQTHFCWKTQGKIPFGGYGSKCKTELHISGAMWR